MSTRRRFVLGTVGAVGAVGGLSIGWSLLPARQRLSTAAPLPAGAGQTPLNGWVKIARDGSVTVMMAKSEMGQGVHTALAMLLADELDADWAQVRTEMSPIDKIYNNLSGVVDGLPFHPDSDGSVKRLAHWLTAKTMREIGIMMTGGSSSIKDLWLPMREAGATARAMLVAAAAQRWKVPAAEVRVDAGVISHASGQRAGFGELVEAAARQPLPDAVTLKTAQQFKLIGKPVARSDAADKSSGRAIFGIDVRPADMLYASVVMCPTLGGGVASIDDKAARAMPGVKDVVQLGAYNGSTAGVAVIADQSWRAMQAAKAVKVTWNVGAAGAVSSAEVMKQLAATLDHDDGFAFHSRGDVDAALKSATKVISAEYSAPYLAHAAMEPINCTVQFKDGRATVWAPTQVPGLARPAAADALGIAAEQVELIVTQLGGGFGRRLDVDFVGQAAAIAKHGQGRPVQTLWTREQDMQHDFYRPACVARFQAGLDAQGHLQAWRNASAGQAITPQIFQRVFGLPFVGPDKTTSEGAFDQPYEVPHMRVGHRAVDLPVPVGFWRAVGHSHQAFFKESFMDEAAAAAGADAVAFRAALLQRHPRHLRVLQRAAELAGWGQTLAPADDGAVKARGVALHHSFGSVVAQVAEVSVGADAPTHKRIRVHRVVCVIDCGLAVNPNIVRQQMESAIVFGLSAALHGGIDIVDGRVQQSNFHDQPVLRMGECPAIEVDIIDSAAHPEGVGEPGLPPIAPAVANAVFAATGQRLRSLPLRIA